MNAAQWYEEKKRGLGLRFLEAVGAKFLQISQSPQHYQKRHQDIRFVLIKKFPFAIHFMVENNTVFVLAVMHTYRNPDSWRT